MAIVDGYATLPEIKAELRLTTTNDDARLERVIEAASRTIDNVTHRKFTIATGARVFGSWGNRVWVDDASTVTLAEESSDQTSWSTVASTAYVTNPRPPIRSLIRTDGSDWLPYVRVTGTWGETAILADVKTACLILAVRYFKRADTPNAILEGDWGAARLARTDPDVYALIRPLVRQVIG